MSAAAAARLRQSRPAPIMPHFNVSYYGGTFGGGVNSQMNDFGARSDGEADVYWELHNLGAGDAAQTRIRETQLNETNFQLAELRAEIGEEVTAAYRPAVAGLQSLLTAQQAVEQALETWRRLRQASFGLAGQQHLYDPLEPLIAERDLNQARIAYLNAVIDYNRAQFRLFWAMGQPPLAASADGHREPISVPVVPARGPEEVQPRPANPPALQPDSLIRLAGSLKEGTGTSRQPKILDEIERSLGTSPLLEVPLEAFAEDVHRGGRSPFGHFTVDVVEHRAAIVGEIPVQPGRVVDHAGAADFVEIDVRHAATDFPGAPTAANASIRGAHVEERLVRIHAGDEFAGHDIFVILAG